MKIVDSSDVDYSQYTYAAMKGNNIASKSVVYRNKYQDKVYILLLISNTVIQGDEVNKRTADALVEYGPVKADNVKPELYLGNDNENLENNTTLLLKPDNKEILCKERMQRVVFVIFCISQMMENGQQFMMQQKMTILM